MAYTYKQIEKYFSKHVFFNSAVHALVGIGVGILLANPFAGVHPIRWGVAFLAVGILGHLYPLTSKK